MGFFSMNEHSNLSNNFDFPVVEGYDGTVGAGLAIVEGYQNDLALFTAAVQSDLAEMAAVNEGADIEALQEASLSGAWEAIKTFFKKLGAKIVALFRAFMAKLESYFNTDTKAYVKKYKKSIQGKSFKDFECKFSKEKTNWYNGISWPSYSENVMTLVTKYDETKKESEKDRSDLIEDFYKQVNSTISTSKEFDEWLHDQAFEDEDTHELDLGGVMEIASALEEGSDRIKKLKSSQDKIKSEIAKAIKDIDKIEKSVNGAYKDSKNGVGSYKGSEINMRTAKDADSKYGYNKYSGKNIINNSDITGDLDKAQTAVSVMRSKASAYQEVVLHMCQTVMKETKFAVAQQKKVFAKAVAYRTVKEDTLLTAIEECAFDEAMEFFDTPYVA